MAKDNDNQNDVVISSRKLGSLSPLPQDILNNIFDFLAKERGQSETLRFLLERFEVKLTYNGLLFNADQQILRKDLYNFFTANTSSVEAINGFLKLKHVIEEKEGDQTSINYNLIDLFLDIANNHKSLNKNELIEYNTSTKELSHKIVTKIYLSGIDGDIVKKIYKYYTAEELDSGAVSFHFLNISQDKLDNVYNLSIEENDDKNRILKNIIGLEFSEIDNNAHKIDKILVKTPNLQKLNLYNCTSINDLTNWPNNCDLSKLEELNLSYSYINAQKLGEILDKTPNLRKLNLAECSQISNITNWPNNCDLSKLEELNLSSPTISAQKLGEILTKTPNLKKLNLVSCKSINDLTNWPNNFDLNKLEELNLAYSGINAQKLGEILAKTTNLKELNLGFCKSINNITNWNNFDLSKLRYLYLSQSSINAQTLGEILVNTPNLKELDLSFCNSINDITNWNNFDLSKLEELKISFSNINNKTLGKILVKIPNLTKLDLANCELIDDLTNLPNDFNLSKLEELELTFSKINNETLDKILAKTPNLKKLNLSYCEELDSNHLKYNLTLASLETVFLHDRKIISRSQILENIKNLETSKVGIGEITHSNNIINPDFPDGVIATNENIVQQHPILENIELKNAKDLRDLKVEIEEMIQNHIPENFGKSKKNFIIEKIGGPCSSDELSSNILANKRKAIRSALNELIDNKLIDNKLIDNKLIDNKDLKLDIGIAKDLEMILNSDHKIKDKFPQLSKVIDESLKKYPNDLGNVPGQSIQASSKEALTRNPLQPNR